jgi:hypothetical protein
MTVLFVRVSLLSLSAFASLGLLINLQPYANPDLSLFLSPEGCSAPCFMSIQPGITTADQAMTFLETHHWVERIIRQPSCLTWEWSGQQPDFMLADAEIARLPAFNHVCHDAHDSVIRQIWFAIKGLTTGEVVLTNGLPERMYVTVVSRAPRYAEVYLAYFRQSIVARIRIPCPIRTERIWQGAVTEIYAVSPLRDSPYDRSFDVPALLNDERC